MRESSEIQSKIVPLPIAVIGSGPVGMLAALKLAALNRQVVLIAPPINQNDRRTTALMMPAIQLLEDVGAWDSMICHEAGMLATMRIIDATKRLIRAPMVSFHAQEIGLTAFGYNIPNRVLNRVLNDKISLEPRIIRHIDEVAHYHHHHRHITLTLKGGDCLDAALVVGADGRLSGARQAAGIQTRQWDYPQNALVLNFSHTRPHHRTANEFHTEQGPFTQVPLKGNRSSLIWVVRPEVAKQLLTLGAQALAAEIETHMHAMLGKITLETDAGEVMPNDFPPQSWPMSGAVPASFAANRTILIGEAAHIFPPIGAQGLNLGFRDVATLTQAVARFSQDPGGAQALAYYNHQRRPDIWLRTGFVHALNRTLLSDLLPLQMLRGASLELLRQFSPLRGFMMREGLTPGAGIYSLFRWRDKPAHLADFTPFRNTHRLNRKPH